jgi:flagellar hook protein FlgE
MSIIGSMYTASTALDAFGDSMAVVGHNIANLNTAGFKASRINYADVMPTVYGEIEAGHGVYVVNASRSFTQGAFESTSNVTDLAIGGNGFFILRDSAGGSYYSRAGQFHLDSAYNLVNPEGYFLQGVAGNISLAGQQSQPAQATTTIDLVVNLDAASTAPTSGFPGGSALPAAWLAGANFSTVVTVFDSLGQGHDLTYLFGKTAGNMWDYRVVANGTEVGGIAGQLQQVSNGTLAFNSDGSLNSSASIINSVGPIAWSANAQGMVPASQTVTATFNNSTQYAGASTLVSLARNGWPQGDLKAIGIDVQGNVRGLYSNGNSQLIDTIQLANFINADDLDPFGDTLFLPTLDSGAAQLGLAGSGGRGDIVSGNLELSTVDLAAEFVTMIASQRAFQMNSRVITTADQMYSVAAELKA